MSAPSIFTFAKNFVINTKGYQILALMNTLMISYTNLTSNVTKDQKG